ncbi:WHSC2 [Lepeophtheirus salmonis]|uniref:WHSC2 n=1 Tax=Lepeophtheirus salmonis TaxID=72036 RepID=A0A7R8CGQ4_LEPSM|nr:WHSC2 [Lepeophtheirus salmonis]CAF2817571.1 WHSC2 [Lepeophtheirus salmonis]
MCSNGNRGVSGTLGSGDTSLWLHNKLGTSNDSWTGGSIVSQLSSETFVKIHNCFQDLQPQVKLKLLLSLFHIPKRNLESWKESLALILGEGKEDSEPWVCMLAEIMQTYPTTGQLNADISIPESNKRIFMDLLTDIRKALKKCCDNIVGHQPQTVRHFTLKRKPKAAALRAELINKSQDAANKVKSISTGNFPIRKNTMPRKMDSTSLKGISSRIQTGFRNSRPTQVALPNRTKKEGGVKLLDINEQPVGYASSKKRKRQSELEDAPKQKDTFSNTVLTNSSPVTKNSSVTSSASTTTVDNINSTPPDYAIGLASLNTPPVSCSNLITLSNSHPAYAPPVYAPPAPVSSKSVTIVNKSMMNNSSSFSSGLSLEPFPPTSSIEVHQSSVFTNTTPPQTMVAVQSSNVQSRVVQLPTHPIPQGRVPHIKFKIRPIIQPHVITADEIVSNTPTTQKSVLIPPSASQPPRRSLTLTKEQMHEAQEMFRTANKVTRPEKALILGFMAGSRDNPCPHLGNLVTIKLSENQDNVPQKDGTYLTMIL